MVMFNVALVCALLGCVFGRQYKIVAESEVDIENMKTKVSHPGYFDNEWRDIYDEQYLRKQPKWRVIETETKNKPYEVRQYDEAWFVSSYTKCLNQSESAADGYVRMYIYMDINNRKHPGKYPLTYPILSKVELGAETIEHSSENVSTYETNEEIVTPTETINRQYVNDASPTQQIHNYIIPVVGTKDKESTKSCPDRFSQHLYLPIPVSQIPPKSLDESITTKIVPKRTYYVRKYADEFTHESQRNCNLQAGLLARTLALSGVRFNPRSYYCAMYEPGRSLVTAHFEVWFEAVNEM